MSRFLSYAGKTLLTGIVALFFLFVIGGVLRFESIFRSSQDQLSHLALHIGTPSAAAGGNTTFQPFWPDYPHTGSRNTQGAVINGVPILTENWETEAAGADVLSFYRDQMVARGWEDMTEQSYGIKPETRDMGKIESGPKAQQFDAEYHRLMDSVLVLKHPPWTMQFSAVPSPLKTGVTEVRIYAAEASSIRDLFEGMEAAFMPNAGESRRPMEALQHDAGQTYHTTIVGSDEPAATAFEQKLASLAADNWRRVNLPPKPGTSGGYYAWVFRGSQYGVLSVTASRKGSGSSVTFMEVTPDGRR